MNARFSAPKGRNVIAQGRAQRRPGFRVPHDFPALQGRHHSRLGTGKWLAASICSALAGLEQKLTRKPRALPWADESRPLGAFLTLRPSVKLLTLLSIQKGTKP